MKTDFGTVKVDIQGLSQGMYDLIKQDLDWEFSIEHGMLPAKLMLFLNEELKRVVSCDHERLEIQQAIAAAILRLATEEGKCKS